jgi:hypothetical protein
MILRRGLLVSDLLDIMGLSCSPHGGEFLGTEVFKGLL